MYALVCARLCGGGGEGGSYVHEYVLIQESYDNCSFFQYSEHYRAHDVHGILYICAMYLYDHFPTYPIAFYEILSYSILSYPTPLIPSPLISPLTSSPLIIPPPLTCSYFFSGD